MAESARPRFPGPQAFRDDPLSRKLFYGRERESLALTQQILAHRLVVLFARSGLGKTSLLKAAIAPNLRAEGYVPLIVRVDDRAAGPLAGIYREIESECTRQGVSYHAGDKSNLWRFFKTAEFWRGDELLPPALVLDQFEELFTLQPADVRSAFIDQLSYVIRGVRPREPGPVSLSGGWGPISDTAPPVKVVISLREEFVPYLEELSDRIPEILAERYRLLPMARESASRAIDEPSAVQDELLGTPPFTLEPQAKEAILSFLERKAVVVPGLPEDRVEPFQLQLICQHVERIARRKAQARPGRIVVTLEEIGGERGLRKILKGFYKRQIAAIPSARERSRARRLCSQFLISVQGRRLRLEESEVLRLTGIGLETLQALLGSRLIRVDQSTAGRYYELSHDSLIAPVLESRRPWFVLYTLILAGGITIATLSLGFVVLGMIGTTMFPDLPSPFRLGLLVALAMILVVGAFYVRRTYPVLREMWRRSVMA